MTVTHMQLIDMPCPGGDDGLPVVVHPPDRHMHRSLRAGVGVGLRLAAVPELVEHCVYCPGVQAVPGLLGRIRRGEVREDLRDA